MLFNLSSRNFARVQIICDRVSVDIYPSLRTFKNHSENWTAFSPVNFTFSLVSTVVHSNVIHFNKLALLKTNIMSDFSAR